jgi:hypothetical protein
MVENKIKEDELKIISVETMHKMDNIYIDVTILDHGEERVETFIGADWLEEDDDGEVKFVKRILENKKILDSRDSNVLTIEDVKKKYVNKVYKVK